MFKTNSLQKQLSDLAATLGIDYFGVADLAVAKDFIYSQGGDAVARFPLSISIGIRLVDAVVDELTRHEDPTVIFTYRSLYNTVNTSLDQATLYIAKTIQEQGFKAYPIAAAQRISNEKLTGAFSHKLAAHLAGLGWIGKNCLLITADHGPRVRWSTILTDAPLETTGVPLTEQCGKCDQCVKICPVQAFTGTAFKDSEPREARYNAHLCAQYIDKRQAIIGDGLCGLCVNACPYGKQKKAPTRQQ